MRLVAIAALFCFSGSSLAEEKKPAGSWTKKVEAFEIKFAFKKDNVMVFTMVNSNENCEMTSKYTVEKDVVKCKVTKYTKNGNFPEIKEGYEFSFKFTTKDKKAEISDIDGKDIDEMAKKIVEGDYEKATD